MKTIDRLSQFISYKGMSLHSFDEKIETSNGYIGKQIKRGASVGSDVLEKVAANFPELNMTWLVVGEGEMIKSATGDFSGRGNVTTQTVSEGSLTQKLYNELLSAKDRIISSQEETIQVLKYALKKNEE